MIDRLDIRFGKVSEVKALSEKSDSPRRKFCIVTVEFPGVGVLQSVGQFSHHRSDMLGEWVLCLINLGTRNMFGHVSEMLVLGIPHPDGGVVEGDRQEAQATYLSPATSEVPGSAGPRKPEVPLDEWLATDMRLGEVVGQSSESLQVQVSAQTWAITLSAAVDLPVEGQGRLIVARDPGHTLIGLVPRTASGGLLLARPKDTRGQLGSKVY